MSFLGGGGTGMGIFGKVDPVGEMLPQPIQKFSDPLELRKKVNSSSTARGLMDPVNLDQDPKRKSMLGS